MKFLKTMKLTLLFTILSFHLAFGNVAAQTVNLSCRQASVGYLIKEINRQTGYDFVFNSTTIENSKPITVTIEDSPITEALEECFKNQPFDYVIKGKSIVLIPLNQQQELLITGRVIDKSKMPLAGTNVSVHGTVKGTTTDADGYFSIKVPLNTKLLFSFIGFDTQEVVILNDKEIIVELNESAWELSGAGVISTGYQKIKPEQSTGSLSVITSKEFESRVNTTNFLDGIQNKIPGLLINDDITFEENSLFQIRGISTIHGNRQPLIVVDGFPTELTFDMINPNEIETITILKDAAAATVYGARSSNGVIIIERKKAKIGKPTVTFRTTLSVTPKENYSKYRWSKNGSEIITEWDKIDPHLLVTANAWDLMNSDTGWGYNISPSVGIMANWLSPTEPITIEERDAQLAELASYNNAKDYARLFLRTATLQTYNLDISGGSESARYYITTNYSDNAQNSIKHNSNNFSLSARTSLQLSPKFKVELTNDFLTSKNSSVPMPGINDLYSYERFEDSNGNPVATHYNSRAHPRYNNFIKGIGLLDNLYYPLLEMDLVNNGVRRVNNRLTVNMRYDFTPNLNIHVGGIYEISSSQTKHLAHQESAEARQLINYYTTGTSPANLLYNVPIGGFLSQENANKDGYTLRAQLNYNKTICYNHTLNLIVGGEIRELVNSSNMASYYGYDDLTLFVLPVNFQTLSNFNAVHAKLNSQLLFDRQYNQRYYKDRFISAYSNIVYSYKEKYSLTGSIRIDQSNLFGTDPKYKYKPLWSAGAAWNIHKEEFMQDLDFVTSMKLRMAYGFNGNVAKNSIPEVIAQNGLNELTPGEITKMLSLYSYANNGLRWEQTRNFNSGLDMTLFDRLDINLDYYIKRSTDILANIQIDATKGGSFALMNQASILNRGVELDLNSDIVSRNRFNLNTGLVVSINKSKVLDVYNESIQSLAPSRSYITGRNADYLKGYAIGALFTLRDAGVDNEGYPLMYDAQGNAKRYFTNDQGIEDVDYVGSSIPVYNAGFNVRVDVGNFYFYGMLHLYGGFKTRVAAPTPYQKRPLEGADNYWRVEGDEEIPGILPFPITQNNSNYLTYSNRYTVNGAYLTLGDLTASYRVRDTKFNESAKISSVEFRAQASNIFTVGFNKFNFSKATRSFEKSYLTPTFTLGLYLNF